MQWTEEAIREALDGHFWTIRHEGAAVVFDALHNEKQPFKAPRKVWDDEALRTLWELKRDGRTIEEIEQIMDRDRRHITDYWHRRRKWAKRVMVNRPRPPTLDDIRRVVCAVYNVSRETFCSESRSRHICEARQVFYWIARRFTGRSFPQIGDAAGGRDHTTVMHGFEKVDRLLSDYRAQIELALLDLGLEMPTPEGKAA